MLKTSKCRISLPWSAPSSSQIWYISLPGPLPSSQLMHQSKVKSLRSQPVQEPPGISCISKILVR